MPWHFLSSIRVSQLTKFFIPFILFIQRSDFLIFSFYDYPQLSVKRVQK